MASGLGGAFLLIETDLQRLAQHAMVISPPAVTPTVKPAATLVAKINEVRKSIRALLVWRLPDMPARGKGGAD